MGGATHANNLPEDGGNVVTVSYTIALGPLVWGLIIGAIHAVVSYNGPSELVRNSPHCFLLGKSTNFRFKKRAWNPRYYTDFGILNTLTHIPELSL